ncbi:MAG: hypothetical protein DMG05_24725 [Acidobacteria bacterium]|nr:MAG: hypothetical protein DMG05_24725 [Acidobacteriota bacterium]
MSERNGDKARFGRERKKKNLQRKRVRELRKVMGLENKTTKRTSTESRQGKTYGSSQLTGQQG